MSSLSWNAGWRRSRWFVPVALIVAVLVGYVVGASLSRRGTPGTHEHAAGEVQAEFWTCSMHPQIRQPEPGQCPICGMDLIPVYAGTGGEEAGPRTLTLSERARKLAEIQVARVERRDLSFEIRMVGKVDYDETRVGYITAWVPGRIDRLWVNYTGVQVARGDPLADLYSPELLSAQEELLQAVRAVDRGRNRVAEGSTRTVDLVRSKLRLWGLTEDQIDGIVARGEPAQHVTLHAPMSGVVVHKHAAEGVYVKTGTQIYTIADLSHVWVNLDAYESDLAWIREGQDVEFEAEAFPGETFEGTVAFIDPVVDAGTRTIRVRVDVPNPRGRLKPEMFVRAVVRAGMRGDEGELSLAVPASAALVTGERAVVYVAVPGREGTYEGREIVLGARAGDYYVVREGLAEGERVVVNGSFKIDSAIQILAKPSMMSPEGGEQVETIHSGPPAEHPPGHVHE